jgi:hypothetical protein
MGSEPRRQQIGDLVAQFVARLLAIEVDVVGLRQGGDFVADAGRLDHRAPMARGEGGDHHPPLVLGREVVAVGAVNVVAGRRALVAGDLCLGDEAEMAQGREGDIGERQLDVLALAGGAAVALGGQEPRDRRHRWPAPFNRIHMLS